MEVSNETKEEIRKVQSDLKNAIRVHQMWFAQLQEDESNDTYKFKVTEAEKEIIAVSQIQKRVLERLRGDLEEYQRRLKQHNKLVDAEREQRYVAQQLREHRARHRRHLHHTNGAEREPSDESKPPSEVSAGKENGDVRESRDNFANALNRVKDTFLASKVQGEVSAWQQASGADSGRSDSEGSLAALSSPPPSAPPSPTPSPTPSPSPPDSPHPLSQETFLRASKVQGEVGAWQKASGADSGRSDSEGSLAALSSPPPSAPPSPTPSPTPSASPPDSPHPLSQETFLRLVGLVTPAQKAALERRRSERRKRCTTSTNRTDFLYENYDMQPKRKKNQFPYLQTCTPPQTRSQRLRRSQRRASRDSSPAGRDPAPPAHAAGEWDGGEGGSAAPAWLASLPAGLTVEPVTDNKSCAGCGRSDVPSLLVYCAACGVHLHTGCGAAGRCPSCRAALPDPVHTNTSTYSHAYRDKLAERARLRERNAELCAELRRLEARAAGLEGSLDRRTDERRELLAAQIETQRNLQRLLDVMSQFKATAASVRSTSGSESGSDRSESRDE